MKNWFDLPAFDSNGCLNVVVESPRGSRIKFVFQPDTNTFLAERMLGLGVAYPFDWGFICGTRADDDDPVDAMVIEDASTYPGTLIKCRPVAMLEMTQVVDGQEETNPRIIAVPVWRDKTQENLRDSQKTQLEQFFLSAVRLTGKQVTVRGWRSADDAVKHVRAHLVPDVNAR
jgi:inorganic pyrophosphatase